MRDTFRTLDGFQHRGRGMKDSGEEYATKKQRLNGNEKGKNMKMKITKERTAGGDKLDSLEIYNGANGCRS